ncbi:FepA family TonB-dependent siderophore receptor [Roseomonas sp. 18066]|uniref:FepA family TonB-dependent siderophore receptor n=1 Tax=Roseomonas sp. 18066 TaxID=2681412 RepID=UPI001F009EB5|nr:FepA family TonB-dependent siderophore receptor [Roseomonas sp. 18066]
MPFNPCRLARLRAGLLAGAAWLAVPAQAALGQAALGQGALDQAAPEVMAARYDVAAGPLGTALNAFARQAGVTLTFAPAQVEGRQSPGLRGATSIERGFASILAGSGLRAVSPDGAIYTLRQAAAAPGQGAALGAGHQAAVALPVLQVVATAEEQARQAPGVSLITRDDIQRAPPANDIAEIVRTMPGVNLTGNSSSGQYGNHRQIDLRGMGPENTLILIDGRAVRSRNAVRMGRSGERNTRGDSNWVPADAIERIEVIRGPAAARYGSGAAGGVVNIVTRPPTDAHHGAVTLYALQPEDRREGDGRRVTATLSGPTTLPGLSFRLYGNANHTDGDSLALNRAAAGTAPGDTPPAGREGVENRDASGLLRWQVDARQSLELALGYSRQGNVYAGDRAVSEAGSALLTALAEAQAETNVMVRRSAALTHRGEWGEAESRVALTYEGTVNKRLREGLTGSVEGSINSRDARSTATLDNLGASAELTLPLEAVAPQRLTLGAELLHEALDDAFSTSQTLNGGQIGGIAMADRPGTASATTVAAFVEDNIRATRWLTLTPGLRLGRHSRFGSHWSPSLNAAIALAGGLSLRGGIARAFKTPNLYQSNPNYIYYSRGNGCPAEFPSLGGGCYVQGNAGLRPETSLNTELGLAYARDRFSSGLTYFHNDYRDKIMAGMVPVGQTPASGRILRWENTPRAIIRGLEAHLALPLLDSLSWSTNATYMIQSEDKATGQPLSLVPRYTVHAALDWQAREALSLRLALTHYGRQEARTQDLTGAANTGAALWRRAPYSVVDVSGSYQLSRHTRLTAGISNLFDRQLFRQANSSAAGANSYNEPGRAYFLALTASF